MNRLEGKAALITGGAGSIGFASARAMLVEGAAVVLADLDRERVDSAVAELASSQVIGCQCDITVAAEVEAAVELAIERFGKLDVVFANAGVHLETAPIAEFPEEVFRRVMEVNVVGTFLVLKSTLACMGEGGSVIINSSVVGLTSAPGIAAYATSKHAVVGLMRTAAKEMAPLGIRVNSIHPGPVDNDFQATVEEEMTGASRQQAAAVFNELIPVGRHAKPTEVAAAVVFLASPESGFVTGVTLPIDGAMSV